MADTGKVLDAMIAELFGDVRRLNDEVEKLKEVLPGQIRRVEAVLPASLAASEERLAGLAERLAAAEQGYRESISELAGQQSERLRSQAGAWFDAGTAQAEERIRKEVQDGLRELRIAVVATVLSEIVRPVRREVEGIRYDVWKILAGFLLCNVLSLCAVLFALWRFGLLPPGLCK